MLNFRVINKEEMPDHSGFSFYSFLNKDGSAYAVYVKYYPYDYEKRSQKQPDYIGYKIDGENILTVNYYRGKCCIDLQKILPCSKADFNRIIAFLDKADTKEASRKSMFIHAYIASCINTAIECRKEHKSDSEYDKQKRKEYTSDIKKYIANNVQLSSSYSVPELTDPEETETIKMKKDLVFTLGMNNGSYIIRRFDGFSFVINGLKFTVHKQFKQYIVSLAENGCQICTAYKKADCISETQKFIDKLADTMQKQPEKLKEFRKRFVDIWNNSEIKISDSNLHIIGSYKAEPLTMDTDAEEKPEEKHSVKPCKRTKAVKRADNKRSRKSRSKAVTEPDTEDKIHAEPETKAEKTEPETAAIVNAEAVDKTDPHAKAETIRTDNVNNDINNFLHRYYSIYQALYDATDYTNIYQESLQAFDKLLAEKTDPEFNAMLDKFVKARHDYVSSDREAAAFYIAFVQDRKAKADAEEEKRLAASMQKSYLKRKENDSDISEELQTALIKDTDPSMQHIVSVYKKGWITYDEMIHELLIQREKLNAEETEAAAFARHDDFTERLKYWYSNGLITWDELKKELLDWHERNLQYEKILAEKDAEKIIENASDTGSGNEKNHSRIKNRSARRTLKKKLRYIPVQSITVEQKPETRKPEMKADNPGNEKSRIEYDLLIQPETMRYRMPDFIDTS